MFHPKLLIKCRRTKVECAGLCLSKESCHAFHWTQQTDVTTVRDNVCKLLKIDEICLETNNNPIEIYADADIDIPSCIGWYSLIISILSMYYKTFIKIESL